jgi:Fe-S-cluster containining protein
MLPAGEFLVWLGGAEESLKPPGAAADVPCGECTACCRASMFIHIAPDETRALERIPRELLFPAPGWPKGHVLMGYDDRGHCPMLVDGRCSIYEDRPRTCRTYDCRVFTATGIPVSDAAQQDITERAAQWSFGYRSAASRIAQAALRAAADFLMTKRDLFPPGALPVQPAQLAALAVRVHRIFEREPRGSDAKIVEAILAAADGRS